MDVCTVFIVVIYICRAVRSTLWQRCHCPWSLPLNRLCGLLLRYSAENGSIRAPFASQCLLMLPVQLAARLNVQKSSITFLKDVSVHKDIRDASVAAKQQLSEHDVKSEMRMVRHKTRTDCAPSCQDAV